LFNLELSQSDTAQGVGGIINVMEKGVNFEERRGRKGSDRMKKEER